MRMTRAFFQTLREPPSEAELASHQLLLRAGYIRPLAAGIYSYLPLARRSLHKIGTIIREEINAIGGQEIAMPVAQPAELWRATGRWDSAYPELVHWRDRAGRDMTLAMTHEEVMADLARREISSYRQLPQLVYHLQTKFRDEPRPRGGLLRVREFVMKDSYSLDADEAGLDRQYRAHWQAYFNIFHRCGLDVVAVGADVGLMGGSLAHEFMAIVDAAGEDTLVLCGHCGYAANRQVAQFRKPDPADEAPAELAKVATPGCKTIADVAAYLGLPTSRTAKAVFFVAERACAPAQVGDAQPATSDPPVLIFAVTRGDMEVNETKLANALSAKLPAAEDPSLAVGSLRPATEEEIRVAGAEPGYASPMGVKGAVVVVDDLVARSPNLVSGANQAGYHLQNVNCGRDYQPDIVADIVAAQAGSPCVNCGSPLTTERGIEVGNIFKLGTRYSEALGASYHDTDGQLRPIVMGSYGIGVGRVLATIAELHHDANGLVWPVSVAPYHVHLVVLPRKAPQAVSVADQLYQDLRAAGVEVLYDDREDASPGVKFNDADLIGLPVRITVGSRSLEQGGVELKRRDQEEKLMVPLSEVVEAVQADLDSLWSAMRERVVAVPYPTPPSKRSTAGQDQP